MMLRSVRAAPATVNLTRRIEGLAGSFRERYGGALPTRIDIFFPKDRGDGRIGKIAGKSDHSGTSPRLLGRIPQEIVL